MESNALFLDVIYFNECYKKYLIDLMLVFYWITCKCVYSNLFIFKCDIFKWNIL